MKNNLFKILTLIMVLCLSLGALFACGNKENCSNIENLPEHTHLYNQKIVEVEFLVEQETCEEKEFYYYSCSCGKQGEESFESNKFGNHQFIDGKCQICNGSDGLEYSLTNNDTEYEVVNIGSCKQAQLIIPSTYNGKLVTSIREFAFQLCNSIESVEIPDTVTNIGKNAFSMCKSLKKVKLSNTIKNINSATFYDCESLKSIEIPIGVETIGNYAFAFCTSLENIQLPNSVTTIIEFAFSNCTKLQNIEMGDKVESIGNYAFYVCDSLERIEISASVNNIGVYAFARCDSLKEIKVASDNTSYKIIDGNLYSFDGKTFVFYLPQKGIVKQTILSIPYGVTTISDFAFEDNVLSKITIPSTVTKIGRFAYCPSLKNIEVDNDNTVYKSIDGNLYSKDEKVLIKYAIGKTDTSFMVPNSVTTIGEFAFSYNEELTSVDFSEGLMTIETNAFIGCKSLSHLELPDTVLEIGGAAFNGCTKLTSVEFGKNLTSIGINAFARCSMESIELPKNLLEIGYGAFSDCAFLYSAKLGDNIKTIDGWVFANCEKLVNVEISDSLVSIDESAFTNCKSLESITYKGNVKQWKRVVITGDIDTSLGVTIMCNNGTIE